MLSSGRLSGSPLSRRAVMTSRIGLQSHKVRHFRLCNIITHFNSTSSLQSSIVQPVCSFASRFIICIPITAIGYSRVSAARSLYREREREREERWNHLNEIECATHYTTAPHKVFTDASGAPPATSHARRYTIYRDQQQSTSPWRRRIDSYVRVLRCSDQARQIEFLSPNGKCRNMPIVVQVEPVVDSVDYIRAGDRRDNWLLARPRNRHVDRQRRSNYVVRWQHLRCALSLYPRTRWLLVLDYSFNCEVSRWSPPSGLTKKSQPVHSFQPLASSIWMACSF